MGDHGGLGGRRGRPRQGTNTPGGQSSSEKFYWKAEEGEGRRKEVKRQRENRRGRQGQRERRESTARKSRKREVKRA